jgi:hypothetical protein
MAGTTTKFIIDPSAMLVYDVKRNCQRLKHVGNWQGIRKNLNVIVVDSHQDIQLNSQFTTSMAISIMWILGT